MSGPRIERLSQRLTRTDDLQSGATADPRLFDADLKQGVVRFQERHGLDADGVVGRRTLQALNVSVEKRIDQLRINLERVRWVFRDVTDQFLVTNIAEFRVFLVRDDEVVWSARAQVGKPYRKTPIFKAELEYLVFNPTWTVPPTILRKDVLPKVKSDPDYLRRKNMSLVERSGRVVDPATVDWSSVSASRFPYSIRQEPGPDNALGRVKFIFPNPHFVFLHDTPSRALFDRAERTFSSGCIRVEQPLDLAEVLLDDPAKWSQESIADVLKARKTKTVFLDEPMTVMLLYLTARVDDEGVVQFRRDVYDRDPRVLKALNGDFVYRAPDGLPEWAGE